MKTSVSIPDEAFAQAERLDRRLNKPRSQLHACAPQEYIAERDVDSITEAIDAIVTAGPEPHGAFVNAVSRKRLRLTSKRR